MSFTRIEAADFVVSSDSVTAPAWSDNSTTLTAFFTASDSVIGNYFLDVYNRPYTASVSEVQFSIAYGRSDGSGSSPLNALVPLNTPTRINFGQYRNLIYGDAEAAVNFGVGNTNSTDLIALQINRNRYKESLFPGTFNLTLANAPTGSIRLCDNSLDVSTITYVDGGRVFDIVSGSNGRSANITPAGSSVTGSTASGKYGLYLPDIGLILLNPRALALLPVSGGIGLSLSTTKTNATAIQNHKNIYAAINSGSNFALNSQETISSDYVFVRIRNQEYNYTTNPSLITGSTGEFIYSNFINSPQTYVTTIGMYNDNNELLAVAKLSKPLVKDFTKEALVRVKLDW